MNGKWNGRRRKANGSGNADSEREVQQAPDEALTRDNQKWKRIVNWKGR